jgi:hypothetical protein
MQIADALVQSSSVGNLVVRRNQNDGAIGVRKTEGQNLRHQRADLAGWEVDDSKHLSANQRFRFIMHGDLRRTLFDADFPAEVDPQFDGGLSRLRKWFGGNDRPDANIHFQKIVDPDSILPYRTRLVGHEFPRIRIALQNVCARQQPLWIPAASEPRLP